MKAHHVWCMLIAVLLASCGGTAPGQCGRPGRSGGTASCGFGGLMCSAGQHCSAQGSCVDGCQSDENCGAAEYCHKEILCGVIDSVGTCAACDRKLSCMGGGGPPPSGGDPLMACRRDSNLDGFCQTPEPPKGYDCPSSVDPSSSGCVLHIGTTWCCPK
jgi:hypothetical protein